MARDSVYTLEMVRRELEKERIRQLIIAEEILRRRGLEAEVRRELMMERELELRRATAAAFEGGAFPSDIRLDMYPGFNASSMLFPNRLHAPILPLHGNVGVAAAMIREDEPPSRLEANSENVISWAKPDPNISKLKHKATTPPAYKLYSANPLKLNEEWTCAICQVNASSEQCLKEHLQGRMHMAKAAELTQRTDKNIRFAFVKGTRRPTRNAEMTPTMRTEEKLKEFSHAKNARETSSDNQNKEGSKQNDGHALQKKLDVGDANEQCGELLVEKM